MKWLLLAAMLTSPFTEGKPIPKPPEHPIIRFLNKDLWKLQELAKQCIKYSHDSDLCVNVSKVNNERIFIIFKVRF